MTARLALPADAPAMAQLFRDSIPVIQPFWPDPIPSVSDEQITALVSRNLPTERFIVDVVGGTIRSWIAFQEARMPRRPDGTPYGPEPAEQNIWWFWRVTGITRAAQILSLVRCYQFYIDGPTGAIARGIQSVWSRLPDAFPAGAGADMLVRFGAVVSEDLQGPYRLRIYHPGAVRARL